MIQMKKKILITGILAAIIIISCFIARYIIDNTNIVVEKVAYQQPPMLDELETEDYSIRYGRMDIKANLPGNKMAEVGYLIPIGPDGKPTARASNMIFYPPAGGQHSTAPAIRDHYVQMAAHTGATVFSLTIYPTEDNNPKRYYSEPESGWHEFAFKVQAIIEEKFALEHHKLLVCGLSSGGSMTLKMAANHPDKIDAIAPVGFATTIPAMRDYSIPTLLLSSRESGDDSTANELAEKLRKNNGRVWCGTLPSNPQIDIMFSHDPSPYAFRLMETFFNGIIDLREANNNIMPPVSQWPQDADNTPMPSEEFAQLWHNRPEREAFLPGESYAVRKSTQPEANKIAIVFSDNQSSFERDIVNNMQY